MATDAGGLAGFPPHPASPPRGRGVTIRRDRGTAPDQPHHGEAQPHPAPAQGDQPFDRHISKSKSTWVIRGLLTLMLFCSVASNAQTSTMQPNRENGVRSKPRDEGTKNVC